MHYLQHGLKLIHRFDCHFFWMLTPVTPLLAVWTPNCELIDHLSPPCTRPGDLGPATSIYPRSIDSHLLIAAQSGPQSPPNNFAATILHFALHRLLVQPV